MTSKLFDKYNQENQIEALLALLPKLKAELHFAQYHPKHKTDLFSRIDTQYKNLKALKESFNIVKDPFYSDIENPVEALQAYQFPEEVYHVDEMEHCQVQIINHEQPYNLENILEQIEQKNAWEHCFNMLEKQPRAWLLTFSSQIKNTQHYHKQCQLKLLNLIQASN